METKNEFELYLEEHPIYGKIKFGSSKTDCDEPLTPTLVMSQVIIDSFLKSFVVIVLVQSLHKYTMF